MTIKEPVMRHAEAGDREKLCRLWQEAFGDEEAFFHLFFNKGFTPENSLVFELSGEIISVLYWFDFYASGQPLAYVYGVATATSHRGTGLASKLLESAKQIIKSRGYKGIILVPAKEKLFGFYEKLSYKIATKVCKTVVEPSKTPAKLTYVTAEKYAVPSS